MAIKKIWYIEIDGEAEGPYSFRELRRDDRVTPDTLVWREGFDSWLPARQVKELKKLFEDEQPLEEEKPGGLTFPVLSDDQMTMTLQYQPPYIYFWFIVLIVLTVYVMLDFYLKTL